MAECDAGSPRSTSPLVAVTYVYLNYSALKKDCNRNDIGSIITVRLWAGSQGLLFLNTSHVQSIADRDCVGCHGALDQHCLLSTALQCRCSRVHLKIHQVLQPFVAS